MRPASALLAALALSLSVALSLGVGGCRHVPVPTTERLIEANPDNTGIRLAIGSKETTEQIILAQIYSQALEAAGYHVKKPVTFISTPKAVHALQRGRVDAYPEFAPGANRLALTTPGLVAFEPTRYSSRSGIFLGGDVSLLVRKHTIARAGPDLRHTIETVQRDLRPAVMRVLDVRVNAEGQGPAAAAAQFLRAAGYTK